MRKKRKGGWRLPVLCYAAVLLVWLGICVGQLLRDVVRRENGSLAERELTIGDASDAFNVYPIDGWDDTATWLLTQDSDPQLVWRLDGAPATRLLFDAKAVNAPDGELVLYYTTGQDEGFSERKKVWATQTAGGQWMFELPGGAVQALRLDPGTAGGVVWRVERIRLNTPRAVWEYFVPTVQTAAVLLLLPLLCWGMLGELWAFVQPTLERRRFESRWKSRG